MRQFGISCRHPTRGRHVSWTAEGLCSVAVVTLLLLATGAFALSPTATPTPEPTATPGPVERCGDVDDDGEVTVTDGVNVLRAAAGLVGNCTRFVCDADSNGSIGVTDGVRVLQAAADFEFVLACPLLVVEEDLSGFARFELSRTGALGFCPPEGSVFGATIERDGSSLRLQLSELVEPAPGEAGCFGLDPIGGRCAQVLPARMLTAEETDRVVAAFRAVPLVRSPDPGLCDEDIAVDPCIINTLRWDGLTVNDQPCRAPRVLVDEVQAMTELLGTLR